MTGGSSILTVIEMTRIIRGHADRFHKVLAKPCWQARFPSSLRVAEGRPDEENPPGMLSKFRVWRARRPAGLALPAAH